MELSEKRLKHSLRVAQKMRNVVMEDPATYRATPEEIFYLGILHDIAYEFVDDSTQHEHVGGNILSGMNFPYWREIFYHGDPDAPYESPELWLLNYIDLTTGPNGEDVTIQERIDDIKERYGEISSQYAKVIRLAEKIRIHFG